MKLFDITLPITNDLPVWPGDPSVSLTMNTSIAKGDGCNVTGIQMGAHTGTHIDAPYHFLQDGATIDSIPLETFMGRCVVIEVDSEVSIQKKDILKYDIAGQSRVLVKTRNSQIWTGAFKSFDTNYVSLGKDAAQYLVEMKVLLVGIDYLSVESFNSPDSSVHKLLLMHNIIILEGLNLSGVKAGLYELFCLPLKLMGCEGAPARVILRDT